MRVIESDSTNYRARTIDNVKASDVTIAFACRFDTSGEVLTRNSALQVGKGYYSVVLPTDGEQLRGWEFARDAASQLRKDGLLANGQVSVNVAGNGMSRFPESVRQEDLDIAVTKIFLLLDARHSFTAVRSGGQTGADEAGLKAGEFFGLDTECLAPKGYRMRMRTDGGGYAESFGRQAFMDRFVRMEHMESLREVMRQMDYLPQDVQVALMRDLSVQYSGPLTVPGKGTVPVDALIELSENTSGKDRLWIGDDTFAEFYNSLPEAEELKAYWARSADSPDMRAYEVSSAGDSAYSAYSAKFDLGTVLPREMSVNRTDMPIGGTSIEKVYQDYVKGSGKGLPPAPESILSVGDGFSKGQKEDFSYYKGYLPLWQEWAVQNPFRIDYLRNLRGDAAAHGQKFVLTDRYASTNVNQARALCDIVNGQLMKDERFEQARVRQLSKPAEGMQMIYSAKVWEYMADYPNSARSLATGKDESEAIEKIRAKYRNEGRYEPENIYDVKPYALKLPTGERIPVSFIRDFDLSWMKETSGEFWGPRLADARRLMDMAERFNRPNGQSLSFYQGTIKPERNVVFVFGSNPEGRHGLGAAKVAAEQFGARYGVGEGLAGSSYALPTKDLRVKENNGYRSISAEDITRNISKMYKCAAAHPDKVFKVAYTHAPDKRSLNGYTGREMITMFLSAGKIPKNVQFSEKWRDEMMSQLSQAKGIKR